VLECARAHVDRFVLESFIAGVERCEDPEHKKLLDRLCDLYALSTIDRNRAWYQEHGRISSTRAKAVIRAVNDLCGEIRPYAFDLVDAFGIPDPVLAAPIGTPGGEASRTSAMTIDDPNVNVRELLSEPVSAARTE
jgi:acyl-CoA oxidase